MEKGDPVGADHSGASADLRRSSQKKMSVAYAPTYINALLAEKDVFSLCTVVEVRMRSRMMPIACDLFVRTLHWMWSTRSGIWQYYENLAEEDFTHLCSLLEHFHFAEVLARYRKGKEVWQDPAAINAIDAWVDAHEQEIYDLLVHELWRIAEELRRNEG